MPTERTCHTSGRPPARRRRADAGIEPRFTLVELSARVGVSASWARRYERTGALPERDCPAGGRRYGEDAVELLRLIAFCREAGFTDEDLIALLPSAGSLATAARGRTAAERRLARLALLTQSAEG
jgi:DNA-binding transcriptional MerR regulator